VALARSLFCLLRVTEPGMTKPQSAIARVDQVPDSPPASDLVLPLLHVDPAMSGSSQVPFELMMSTGRRETIGAPSQFTPSCSGVGGGLLA
jgi:hypothetical protein